MTISYNWLSTYLPVKIEPEKLSLILTSLGLEVESLEPYEEIKGNLEGLVIGYVTEVQKHPNADKLRVAKVDIGKEEPLQIVCGAPNVAAGQKVIVAPVGATIYPTKGNPVTMKLATIRGVESFGMICAEDEVGISDNHAGIMILNDDAVQGTAVVDHLKPQSDWIYEIGLTPNRMDAMSHLGVAKDVCAYLTVHRQQNYAVLYPYKEDFKKDKEGDAFEVIIKNTEACQRYSGVYIENVTIKESPDWLKQRLRSIGIRSINNIVDITNFILHETGQPLHAFDADKISGRKLIVQNLPAGTPFITLDEKERKVNAEDIMICDGAGTPMCFGGVFGGLNSGVTEHTKNIFLESAWFNPVVIRKTSFKHNLRTDAAARFEKGVDISNTVNVLKRAVLLIKETAGGVIASDVMDIYPDARPQKRITLTYDYLKRLSGKVYNAETVESILSVLGFKVVSNSPEAIVVDAPYSKPDVELPADVVEEIMRIDGYDNVEIPQNISISPSVEALGFQFALKEKIANYLSGNGFYEIFTNSITNSAYFTEEVLSTSVKMLNSLSANLNIMRPSMLETGLECILHNLNRKNNSLRLYEFGKVYTTAGVGKYSETDKLSLYITGLTREASWKHKDEKSDIYYLKGIAGNILKLSGIEEYTVTVSTQKQMQYSLQVKQGNVLLISLGLVQSSVAKNFDIKQPVYYGEVEWHALCSLAAKQKSGYKEIPRFPAVQRDLAIVIDKNLSFEKVETSVAKANIKKLQSVKLFDLFESDKLGKDKKSFAVNFTFIDAEKTLTDTEIDKMMQKIMQVFEQDLNAEIRK